MFDFNKFGIRKIDMIVSYNGLQRLLIDNNMKKLI